MVYKSRLGMNIRSQRLNTVVPVVQVALSIRMGSWQILSSDGEREQCSISKPLIILFPLLVHCFLVLRTRFEAGTHCSLLITTLYECLALRFSMCEVFLEDVYSCCTCLVSSVIGDNRIFEHVIMSRFQLQPHIPTSLFII